MLPLFGGIAGTLGICLRASWQPKDFRALVTALAREHPEVRPLLATALEQEPDSESGNFLFLQLRVIDEALGHPRKNFWTQTLRRKLAFAKLTNVFAVTAFVIFFSMNHSGTRLASGPWLASEITVTPGNAQIERGTGLVISARFGRKPPPEAAVVLISALGKTKRIPLARHLSDPVFGASLLEVTEDAAYHVEYSSKKTDDYKISVFDYPALTRADASLRFPDYTGLTNKIIPDTRRITAVEGSRLSYTLELNKPVAHARLIGKEETLSLTVRSNAIAALPEVTLANSGHYALELVDTEGRTNKAPAEFVIQVLPNRPPDLKVIFPRGDPRVSALEEVQLQAEATDDFGLVKYGIGFGVAGQEPKFVELGQRTSANDKRLFGQLIPLEKLGVEVDQIVSYFAWADDYGPDGQVRRTFSDMFFAEVRPFEQIFRADQSGMPDGGDQNQGGRGTQSVKLAELQKRIVIATWKLQREKNITRTTQP
jgi:hypothetical protein